jgi:hypothetical protein
MQEVHVPGLAFVFPDLAVSRAEVLLAGLCNAAASTPELCPYSRS